MTAVNVWNVWKTILQYLVKLKINPPLSQTFSVSFQTLNIRGRRGPETTSTCVQGARTGTMDVGMCVRTYLYNPQHTNCEHKSTGRPYGNHAHVYVWAETPHTETVSACEQGDRPSWGHCRRVPTARGGEQDKDSGCLHRWPAMNGYLSVQGTDQTLQK